MHFPIYHRNDFFGCGYNKDMLLSVNIYLYKYIYIHKNMYCGFLLEGIEV